MTNVLRCENGAPFIAYQGKKGYWHVTQGNCNSWSCARCGPLRARKEYGRIVHGAEELSAKHQLWFVTLTTRGSGYTVKQAHADYYANTNRLLSAARAEAKRQDAYWCYVQVTEHQKRGHPHSHILTTWRPADTTAGKKYRYITDNTGRRKREYYDTHTSDWLDRRCRSAGLGHIYDISSVRSAAGASRYVAKYLFKGSMLSARFPRKWKRVRYSRNWPKLPEHDGHAMALLSMNDWRKLFSLAMVLAPHDEDSLHAIVARWQDTGTVLDTARVDNDFNSC